MTKKIKGYIQRSLVLISNLTLTQVFQNLRRETMKKKLYSWLAKIIFFKKKLENEVFTHNISFFFSTTSLNFPRLCICIEKNAFQYKVFPIEKEGMFLGVFLRAPCSGFLLGKWRKKQIFSCSVLNVKKACFMKQFTGSKIEYIS